MRSLLRRGRRALPSTAYVASWLRYQAESKLLVPAARRFPEWIPRLLASFCAALESFTRIGSLYRAELRSSHGLSGIALWRMAYERARVGYLDVVYFARGAAHDGDPTRGYRLDITLPDDVQQHVRSGRPLIIVGAHFPFVVGYAAAKLLRSLQVEAWGPEAVLGMVVSAGAPPSRHAGVRRDILRGELVAGALDAVATDEPSVHHIRVAPHRATSTGAQLVRDSRSRGSVIMITLDREWSSGSAYRRRFAGFDDWGLSTGWARLATAADAGVVALSPSAGSGAGHAEWSPVRLARDFETVHDLVDCFADDLERRIGRFPAGYQLALGRPRRWDPASECWRPPTE